MNSGALLQQIKYWEDWDCLQWHPSLLCYDNPHNEFAWVSLKNGTIQLFPTSFQIFACLNHIYSLYSIILTILPWIRDKEKYHHIIHSTNLRCSWINYLVQLYVSHYSQPSEILPFFSLYCTSFQCTLKEDMKPPPPFFSLFPSNKFYL